MEKIENLFETVGIASKFEDAAEAISLSYFQDVCRRLKRNKTALFCLVIIAVMILGSIFVPIFSHYSISDQNSEQLNLGLFTQGHIFGTDNLGRDMFTRVWYGTRISLIIAFSAVMIDLLIGMFYGGIAGYLGGKVDEAMMRFVDIIIAIPYLIIVILLMVVLKPGITTIIIAYATVGWTGMARLVRGQIVKLRGNEHVLAASLLGASDWHIITKHLLPNTLGVVIVNLTLTIPSAIFTEAFLSYIGLGVQIPLASLGTLASDGTSSFLLHPTQLLTPALFLCVTMLVFNLLGDALRDILDPKLRK